MKISYNAPVVLSYALLCLIVMFLGSFVSRDIIYTWFTLPGRLDWNKVSHLFTLISYIIGHQNWEHLFGNIMLLLLIGPIIEEKYGSTRVFTMILITAIITALLHILLPGNTGLVGASGIVFMLMVLCSLVNFKKGEIPLTFILIAVLFIGKEVVTGLRQDQISQFAHIIGGLCGSLFGFRKGISASSQPTTTA